MSDTKFKILLVEDDEALRFIVKDNLEQNNYDVKIAEDGEIALDLFNKNSFDVIVLDVMLPKIDGFQVAETIRKTNEQLPIIFLTARVQKEDIIKGFELGAVDYIIKPFNFNELISRVRTHIDLKQKTERLLNINIELEEKVEERTQQLRIANAELKEDDAMTSKDFDPENWEKSDED